ASAIRARICRSRRLSDRNRGSSSWSARIRCVARLFIDGSSNVRPAATARMAPVMSAVRRVFSRYPEASAITAARSASSSSNAVRTRHRTSGCDCRMARHRSIPLPSGSMTSSTATSGRTAAIRRRASAQLEASPTTWRSGCRSTTPATPLRTTSWSSTRKTLVISHHLSPLRWSAGTAAASIPQCTERPFGLHVTGRGARGTKDPTARRSGAEDWQHPRCDHQGSRNTMRALVVYESMFGNTAAIAQAVADGLSTGAEVTLTHVADAPADVPPDVDVVVVGGPTHTFTMSREATREEAARRGGDRTPGGIREWLQALPTGGHPQDFVAFDTRVNMPLLPGA